LLLVAVWQFSRPRRDSLWEMSAAAPLPAGEYRVAAVIDGDTLKVELPNQDGITATVRLLGIDAPEDTSVREPFGPEATAFLREKLLGQVVTLEWDKRRIDRYGRRLAYVYFQGRCVNEELAAAGLAKLFSYPGDNATQARALTKAAAAARRQGLGLWQQESSTPLLPTVDAEATAVE
jgi:micrococcal nuclease